MTGTRRDLVASHLGLARHRAAQTGLEIRTAYREGRQAVAVVSARAHARKSEWPRIATVADVGAHLSGYDVVSFDIFDTLLLRVFADPVSVFDLVVRYAGDREVELPAGWVGARIRAGVARKSNGAEHTLPEIHELAAAWSGLPASQAPLLAELEYRLETSACRPSRRGTALFATATDARTTIAVLSDMYLSQEQLAQLLRGNGFTGWDFLLASAERGTSKRKGTSFDTLRSRYPDRSIVHVGDNPTSDLVAARQRGVDAVELRRLDTLRRERPAITPSGSRRAKPSGLAASPLGHSLHNGLIEAWIEGLGRHPRPAEEFGFELLGPMLVGFALHLDIVARRHGYEHLAFLSREGKLLRASYAALVDGGAVEHSYLRVSRRALGPAALARPLTELDYDYLGTSPAPMAISRYLANALPDFDVAKAYAVLAQDELRLDQVMGRDKARIALRPLFDAFGDELVASGVDDAAAATAYLDTALPTDRRLALVDIGWRGTMQARLSQLTGRPLDGVYLALDPRATVPPKSRTSAWLDGRGGGPGAREAGIALAHTRVLEPMFTDPLERSVRRIELDDTASITFAVQPPDVPPQQVSTVQDVQTAALAYVDAYADVRRSVPADAPSVLGALDEQFGTLGAAPLLTALRTPSSRHRRVLRAFALVDHGFAAACA